MYKHALFIPDEYFDVECKPGGEVILRLETAKMKYIDVTQPIFVANTPGARSCLFSENGRYWQFDTNVLSCGFTSEPDPVDDRYILYKNQVRTFAKATVTGITRDYDVILSFECRYKRVNLHAFGTHNADFTRIDNEVVILGESGFTAESAGKCRKLRALFGLLSTICTCLVCSI